METRAAASLAATNKTNKYSQLSATQIFKQPVPGTTRQLSWSRNWEVG